MKANRLNIRTRLIIAFLVTVLIPLISTGLYGNWTTSRTLQAKALENAQSDLRLRAMEIVGFLAHGVEDTLYISKLPSMQAFLASHSPTADQAASLEADFTAFANTHQDIFQIRYIDAAGMEVIRVDKKQEGVRTTPKEELQDKSHRYYFTATMELPAGEVFVSSLDLNRENGVIQIPHTPTIRYATPVFHPDGRQAGIVILNLFAEPLLSFARLDSTQSTVLALVDESGYYLTHPDPTRQWSSPNDLNTGHNAAKDYPQGWQMISQFGSGVYDPPPESFLGLLRDELLPVGMLAIGPDASLSHRVLVYQQVSLNQEDGPRWYLIRDEPHANLFASIWVFRMTAIGILAGAALVAFGIAISLAHTLTAPIISLTNEVRDFVQTRLGKRLQLLPVKQPPRGNEIEELTQAFREMSTAITQHLEQLTVLNQAGHRIAARLESPAVIEAAVRAIEALLPASYLVIRLEDELLYAAGDEQWAPYRQLESLQSVLQATMAGSEWRIVGLSASGLPKGCLCCAPLCVDGRPGLVELYGADPQLGDSSSGDLLATLAAQISISLDNAILYGKLTQRQKELQSLVQQLINAQEEERRVVAYDIHDGLMQMLVGARLQLQNFIADRETASHRAEAALRKGLDELSRAIIEARRVIEGLRPAALDDLGLIAVLREITDEMARTCRCTVEFHAEPPQMRLPAEIEATAFRIAQEALNNARKYAQSSRLRVVLRRENHHLNLEVRDWGQGFDLQTIGEGRGVGLAGMRERARLVGGVCEIFSTPGGGTLIQARLPLPST